MSSSSDVMLYVYWCPVCERQTERPWHVARRSSNPLIPQWDDEHECERIEVVPAAGLAAVERERDEARYRPPMGDNHHNAAGCPYCGDLLRAVEARADAAERLAEDRLAFNEQLVLAVAQLQETLRAIETADSAELAAAIARAALAGNESGGE